MQILGLIMVALTALCGSVNAGQPGDWQNTSGVSGYTVQGATGGGLQLASSKDGKWDDSWVVKPDADKPSQDDQPKDSKPSQTKKPAGPAPADQPPQPDLTKSPAKTDSPPAPKPPATPAEPRKPAQAQPQLPPAQPPQTPVADQGVEETPPEINIEPGPGLDIKKALDDLLARDREKVRLTFTKAFYDSKLESLVFENPKVWNPAKPKKDYIVADKWSIKAFKLRPGEFWPERLDFTISNFRFFERGKLGDFWTDREVLKIAGGKPRVNLHIAVGFDDKAHMLSIDSVRVWDQRLGSIDLGTQLKITPGLGEKDLKDNKKPLEAVIQGMAGGVSLVWAQASYTDNGLFDRMVKAEARGKSLNKTKGKLLEDLMDELGDMDDGRFLHLAPEVVRFVLNPKKITFRLDAKQPVGFMQLIMKTVDLEDYIKLSVQAYPVLPCRLPDGGIKTK